MPVAKRPARAVSGELFFHLLFLLGEKQKGRREVLYILPHNRVVKIMELQAESIINSVTIQFLGKKKDLLGKFDV